MPGIAIKDTYREIRLFQSRLFVTTLFVLLLFLTLVGRMVYLQVVQYEHYTTLSQNNRISIIPIPPVRGLILDRNGIVLAQNFPAYTLEVVPDLVPDMERLLEDLGRLTELAPRDLERFRRLLKRRPGFESLTLRGRLSEAEAARFAVNRHRLTGAKLRAQLQRHYPLGSLGVHVVGYVGRISDQDLKVINKARYRGNDYIGKVGVEAFYEEVLLGKNGYEQVEINAHGRVVRRLARNAPIAGKNVYLNIDIRLQEVAERALGKYKGAVVAIEPKTGAVLAFASTPTYDPNPFVNGIDEESYSMLRDSAERPLLNRALTGLYAPGSTIKVFLGLAALEYGRNPDKKKFCPGWFSLPGSSRRYRDWRKSGHGWVDLHDAIVQSCDVYFYDLAVYLGIDRMHDFLGKFGFGKKTGIDLKGEGDGLVPSVEWKRRVRRQPWYPGETVITGIGQGYLLVTPLQLAQALTVIANRGRGMRPRIVYAIEDRASKALKKLEPLPSSEVVVKNRQYFDQIIQAMTDVVHSRWGTGRRIGRGAKYRIAGKTGTTQVIGIAQNETYDESKVAERLRDHSLFIAFAPVEDPKIAVAVVAENGGHGSRTAAPIAKKVLDYYLLSSAQAARSGDG